MIRRTDLKRKLLNGGPEAEEIISNIILLYKTGKTIREIRKIYHAQIDTISKILRDNKIDVLMGTKRKFNDRDFNLIIEDYKNGKTLNFLTKKYRISFVALKNFLLSGNIEIRTTGSYATEKCRFSEDTEKDIISKYVIDKLPISKIAEIYSCDFSKVKKILINYGISIVSKYTQEKAKVDPSHENEIVKLHKEGSTIKQISKKFHKSQNSIRNALIKNGFPPKTPLQIFSKKFGHIGTYKNLLFRSLMELSFILDNENAYNIESAEKFKIPYFFNGKNRKYYPDFLLNNSTIVEIKPKSYWYDEIILAKNSAAIKFCEQNNFTFKITDWEIDKNKIKPLILNGEVKILNKSVESVNKYFGISL